MVSKTTLQNVRQFCKPGVDAGIIPQDELRELLKAANKQQGNGQNKAEEKHLLRTSDVARRLDCCERTVLRLKDRGVLRGIYLSPGNHKSLRFSSEDLNALIEKGGAGDE